MPDGVGAGADGCCWMPSGSVIVISPVELPEKANRVVHTVPFSSPTFWHLANLKQVPEQQMRVYPARNSCRFFRRKLVPETPSAGQVNTAAIRICGGGAHGPPRYAGKGSGRRHSCHSRSASPAVPSDVLLADPLRFPTPPDLSHSGFRCHHRRTTSPVRTKSPFLLHKMKYNYL
jgi:hypothetical protein